MWAGLYWILGALPDGKFALLYSLGAMTTYGHEAFYLADHWRLMGSLEALNGMILFGLTTGFLFALIKGVPPKSRLNSKGLAKRDSVPKYHSDTEIFIRSPIKDARRVKVPVAV